HHAGHGGGGAGAHTNEQRVGSVAKPPLDLALDGGHRLLDVALQWLAQTFAQVRLTLAGLDGETRRHRQAELVAHEPQAKALAAKPRAQPRMGLAVPEIEKRDRWRRFQRPVSSARRRRALLASASSNSFFLAKTLAFKSDTDIILLTLSAASSTPYEKTMSELAELSVEPLPSPPTQKGLAMRERLLKAAARAFTRRGYELTRVEDIVKAARTSYGNFYRHFRNKDEVLMAVLR